MKIGYVLRSLEDSGVTVYCLRLADAVRRRGHDVFLVSDGGPYESEVQRLGLRHIPLALCRGPLTSYRAARQLAAIVRRERPDVLHANWRRAQMACHLAERATGVPFVSTLHLVGIPDTWFYRRLTHWGSAVIAPCTEAVTYLREAFRVPEDRVRLIFHGVDPGEWPVASQDARQAARRKLGLPPGVPVLACVARLEKIKGHDVLLRALGTVRASRIELRLLLVGTGDEETALRRLSEALKLSDVVLFLGHRDPRGPLAAADLFVLTSIRESFGLAPLEAMFMGLPVLRTNSHGASDQIVDGECGRIVSVGDAAAVARALTELLSDSARLRLMGDAARRRAMSLFCLDTMAGRVEALYHEVIARGRPAGDGRDS